MMEPYNPVTGRMLPKISDAGNTPMGAYAAGFDPTSLRPRVGLLVAGIGMSDSDSMAAIKNLPGVSRLRSPSVPAVTSTICWRSFD